MHRFLAGCAVLLMSASAANGQPGKGSANKFGWYGDYNAAKAEAKRTGKPMFLVFRCEP
jgi:opacity protein-like surface antigen